MEVQHLIYLSIVVNILCMTTSYAIFIPPRPAYQCPPRPICYSPMATPFPAFIESIESIDYVADICEPCYNDQLILPPLSVELPCGLGYLPAAVPLVAKYYGPAIDVVPTGAYIPVACDSLVLAAPVDPEYAALVKPIIL